MARKSNIRSIRFSDEIAEMIEQQVGRTFTEKFENLITRCMWELPNKEKEIARLNEQIRKKREQLMEMSKQAGELSMTINRLLPKVKDLEATISREAEKWET